VTFTAFSPKQLKVLTWWCRNSVYKDRDAIICDGAVRSGKTMCMSVSFIAWAMGSFNDTSFALCGKTVTSLRRNVITPLLPILRELGFECSEKVSKGLVEVTYGRTSNRFYLFGGRDESSAALIQGLTLGGVLLDEVALMPRSFVEQALARCSVTGSKLWFNCNPENPLHWFYTEWIKKAEEKNCLYIHFVMEDNPSLSKAIIERYHNLYSGAFYERFVEGKWVAAEGLIYDFFDESYVQEVPTGEFSEYYVSCDYGTLNPASFGLWGRQKDVWYRIKEYYFAARSEGYQKTDAEYVRDFMRLIGNKKIKGAVVDPSAASFIEALRREGINVIKAQNDVLSGIRITADMLKSGKIVICDECHDALREFSLYVWDDRKGDCPKKENDHAMDEIRYFAATVVKENEDGFAATFVER